MKGKKLYIILGIIVVLLIIIAIAKGGSSGKEIKVAVESAAKRSIIESVSASGKVQPEIEVKISSDVSGEIVELPVVEGQEVKKGQLLVKIKPDTYESARDRAQAALDNSRANLANSKARLVQAEASFDAAEKDFKRQKQLFEKKAISPAQFEQAEVQYSSSKADLEAARQTVLGGQFSVESAIATLKEARENLEKTTIYAPTDGTVSKLNVEVGERVVGTLQMTGTELMRIADLKNMEVNVEVNENDIVKVTRGDTCEVEVDAYINQKFTGVVTEIANSAINLDMNMDQVTNFEVKISILRSSYKDLIDKDNPHLSPFRPGMSAAVEIFTNKASNVVSVPIQAVTLRTDSVVSLLDKFKDNTDAEEADEEEKEPMECVFINRDGKAAIVFVETGIQDSKYFQIKKGLKGGEEVIVAPYSAISKTLNHGDKLVVVPKGELFEEE